MTPLDKLAAKFTDLKIGSFFEEKVTVYVLAFEGEVVYVGQTTNLAGRLGDHSQDKSFDRVLFLELSPKDASLLEGALTRALDPYYCSKTSKDSGCDVEVLAPFGLAPDPDCAFQRRLDALNREMGERYRKKANSPRERAFRRALRDHKKAKGARLAAFIEAA